MRHNFKNHLSLELLRNVFFTNTSTLAINHLERFVTEISCEHVIPLLHFYVLSYLVALKGAKSGEEK